VIHEQRRNEISEDLQSGQNIEAERELLRPVFGQRLHFGETRFATRAALISPIQQACR
jgi:hypothetical protein